MMKASLVFLQFLLIFGNGALGSDCPKDWKPYENSCYLIVAHTLTVPRKTWEDARAVCLSHGGDLVSITDDKEAKFVKNQTSSFGRNSFWIGLYRNKTTNSPTEGWIWIDGSNSTFRRWQWGEPNNYKQQENCAEVYSFRDLWNDNNCDNKMAYICERKKGLPHPTSFAPTLPPVQTTAVCDFGWEAFRQSCYKLKEIPETWYAAKRSCEGLGGHLLTIDDVVEQNYFVIELSKANKNYWIGLSDIGQRNGHYVWESNKNKLVNFTNWYTGEPNGNNEHCVEMYGGISSGYWNDKSCPLSMYYICEKDGNNVCPADWTLFEDDCYQFNLAESQIKNWQGAQKACESLGDFSSLVSIHSQAQQDFITKEITSTVRAEVWIGLNDIEIEKVSSWSDKTSLDYVNFFEGSRKTNRGWKDCVLLLGIVNNGPWTFDSCSKRRRYICQRHKGLFSCNTPLGMENGGIGDDQITASGQLNISTGPEKSRLRSNGSWCPPSDKKYEHYLQVDLGSVYRITNMAVQALTGTSFCIKYGVDNRGYKQYGSPGRTCEELRVNTNEEIHEIQNLKPYIARYVRIFPKKGVERCLRIEFFGCLSAKTVEQGARRSIWEKLRFSSEYYKLDHVPYSDIYYQINHIVLTWTDARSYCLDQNADLLSLSTSELSQFFKDRLKRLRPYEFWIGLNDRDYTSNYYWSDGSPMVFYNWNRGYPRDSYGMYGCVKYRRMGGYWVDASCAEIRPFICMKTEERLRRGRPFHSMLGSGVTGVWMSSASYYSPLSNVENNTISGTRSGTAYGTIETVSGVKDKPNSALKFVGSGSYIDVPLNLECLTFPDACSVTGVTLSFMASFDELSANWEEKVYIIDSIGGTGRDSTGVAVYIKNKRMFLAVATIDAYWRTDAAIHGDGVWRHYAMDWTPLAISVYVNGKNVNSRAYWPTEKKEKHSKDLKKNLHIGIQSNAAVKSGAVSLAMLAFWETLLTHNDFSAIYKIEFGWCPFGWTEFGMSCYQFENERKTWLNARSQCLNSGGDLVAIGSPVEQGFITQQTHSSSWIGFSALRPSNFSWSNSAPVVYTNWRSPRSFRNRFSQVCAATQGRGFGVWSDSLSCRSRQAFVCEKEKHEDKPAINESVVGVPMFIRICQYSRAILACPNDFNLKITSAFWGRKRRDICRYVSIIDCGLKEIEKTTNKLKKQCDGLSTCRLYASQHDNYFGNPCLGVYKYLEVNYTCVSKDHNKDKHCPTGWKRSLDGNICYGLMLSKKSWMEAEKTCQRFHAQLISIDGRFEMAMITSLMERAWDLDIWIGLNDLKTKGVYVWSDNFPVSWTNWYAGYPYGSYTGKNCVYINLKRAKKDWMFWRNGNCSREASFICKKRIGEQRKPTSSVTAGNRCFYGWTMYRNMCYKVYTQWMSWLAARQYCTRSRIGQSNLASITNKEENDFITNLANDTVWIGLETKGVFRGHVWSNRNPVAYTNWDIGQPDSYNGREACTQLYAYSGNWHDARCSSRKPFVCKKKTYSSVHGPTPSTTFGPSTLCRKGWILYNNMCYFIANNTLSDWKTWHEADLSCRTFASHLLSVQNEAEKDFLVQVTRGNSAYTFWIGLHDLDGESRYAWTDGSSYGNYIFWSNGEPNNFHGQEDCVAMIRLSGKWNDNHCSSKKSYICKANNENAAKIFTLAPARKVSADGYCAPGWIANGKSCYEFHTNPTDYKTWLDAQRTCEKGLNSSDVGELVSIANEFEQAFITMNIKGAKVPLWIGMNNFHNTRSFIWADNSPFNFQHWHKGQPISGWNRYCVEISPFARDAGRWSSVACNSKLNGYICKADASNTPSTAQPSVISTPEVQASFACPKGYSVYGESCYKFVKTPKTFDDARKSCKGDKAELVSIGSEFDQAHLVYLLERNIGNVWIGLLHEPWSSFKFTDNTSPLYSYWGIGQPNRQLDRRSCVQANVTGSDLGRWDDVDCGRENPYVCQIYHGQPKVTVSEDSVCAAGWRKKQRFCYKHFDIAKSWPEASHACKNVGGELLSISDDREQDFAMFYFFNMPRFWIWIGLNDRNEERGYQWSDNRPVTYVNWRNGQPNDPTQTQNCVLMDSRTGKWVDWHCVSRYSYICKRSLGCSSLLPLRPSMISVSESIAANLSAEQAIMSDLSDTPNDAWCTNDSAVDPQVQIHLGKMIKITRITIQGRNQPSPQYVRSFIVKYSTDGWSWTIYSLRGITKIFFANIDGTNKVTKTFDRPIIASSIIILPSNVKGETICMKVQLRGCDLVCQAHLGMTTGHIKDNYIIAKSAKYPTNEPKQARPHLQGWCAKTNDDKQWIEVNFWKVNLVTKIKTWGNQEDSYVKSYKIQFSSDGDEWIDYKQHGAIRVFDGNLHAKYPVVNSLKNSIQATFIRILPVTWNKNVCMRFELYGCAVDCDEPLIQRGENTLDVKLSSPAPNSFPEDARLNSGRAWCTKAEKGQYLEVDFKRRVRLKKIASQGSPLYYGKPRRVVTFTIYRYKTGRWKPYTVEKSVKHIVSGSLNDSTLLDEYSFMERSNGLVARKLRIYPELYTKAGICMRVEFYGCLAEAEIKPTTLPTTQKLLNVSVRFTSLSWNDALSDPSSKEFKTVAKDIKNSVESIYENDKDSSEGEALREVIIKRLRKGSVIADMTLVFNPEFAQHKNISKPLVDAVKSGSIANMKVDKDSLRIEDGSQPPKAIRKENKSISSGAIAALVVGILLILLVVLGIGFYCKRKRAKEHYAPKQFNNPILYSTANTDEFEIE